MTTILTRRGMDVLRLELDELKLTGRENVAKEIAEARSYGDLRENSEYAAAMEKQRIMEKRIKDLEDLLDVADVFDPAEVKNPKEIRFGAKVELVNKATKKEKSVQIVSEHESNLEQGLISIDAPFARGLLGKNEGETALITMAGKEVEFLVKSVSY